ncbi:serine hydrolase domain-containing protein [Leifsonia sp. 21MFCrub1.1]|uniref:serine hydrolase domain-containing protein n=1 Tax=Leifsonia sp. 21MFCrub1.1 TaxID=1798223 RepID=UPI0008929693|nr:serine hydrolase domain-containing protein [Leifsonia sp. 21MFCrub1.1]SEB14526.1 D-alanyl-D-alanine carboxypeptidase [Leifsonia sp. 21MFCrub1.1]
MRRHTTFGRIALAATAGLVALVLSACTSTAGAKLPQQQKGGFDGDVEKRLSAAITDAMTLADASAGFAGVWAPWAGSWTTAQGTTKRGGTQPVSADMRFRVGQNTTPMTCTVLLQLVDEGEVGLDDPLTKWLPGLVGVEGVTLRELCQNTSGIGDYVAQLNPEFLMNPTRQWPALELASDGIAMQRVGKPGEKWGRSSTNAVLLGMALQNATSRSWQDLYKRYIFDKLGMTASSLPESAQFTVPGPHAAGYSAGLDGAGAIVCEPMRDVSSMSPSQGWTAGGVVSTVSDMKAFGQALASGSLLSEKSRAAQADGIAIGQSWERYGLGMQLLGPLRGSSGAVPGYLSAVYTDPASGLTIVVALNNSTAGPGFAQLLAQRLASIVSKTPAKEKGAKVVASLPWSEQQTVDALTKAAPCPAKKAG